MQDNASMKIVKIHGIDIHYDVFGEGPPILLIMGLGGRGDAWTPVSQALAGAGYQAIQFDNRDTGWSSYLSGVNYEVSDMAADAVGLLDTLGIEQANLVGISMGGMIAQEIMAAHSSRVRRAVLMATSPGGPEAVMPAPQVIQNLIGLMGNQSDGIGKLYAAITGPGFAEANGHLIELAVQGALLKPTLPDALKRQSEAVMRWSTSGRLSKSSVPTLVMHGDADPLIPYANGVFIAETIPGARLHTLKGVGHLVPLEAPQEVIRVIGAFFKEAGSS